MYKRQTPYGLAVTVSDVDSRTGMEVGATILLDAGHTWITMQPYARNGTAEPHPYQLWLNAMLALSGNTMSGQTRFIIPAAEVVVHSTGDGGAPGSGATMGWPSPTCSFSMSQPPASTPGWRRR